MYAQLCVEDLVIDQKLRDKKYIESQLKCVLADHNEFCDEFGLKLKSKYFFPVHSVENTAIYYHTEIFREINLCNDLLVKSLVYTEFFQKT